ncbi:hypothetical protein B9479_005977 [Cryptococcus floricola]|uniref:Uncharacterized protein n=1 Tax=Cryptococcus floricola TaxID=2591691 RepID=A0A5D3APA9_9TREE|nr:hypothetical protein B9479_005977 [Cryptococcus floricola]
MSFPKLITTFPLPTFAPTVQQCFVPALSIVIVLLHTGLDEDIGLIQADKLCRGLLEGAEDGGMDGFGEGQEEYIYHPGPLSTTPTSLAISVPDISAPSAAPPTHDPTRFTDITLPNGRPAFSFIPRGFDHKGSRPGLDVRARAGWRRQRQRQRVERWGALGDIEEGEDGSVESEGSEAGSGKRGSLYGEDEVGVRGTPARGREHTRVYVHPQSTQLNDRRSPYTHKSENYQEEVKNDGDRAWDEEEGYAEDTRLRWE